MCRKGRLFLSVAAIMALLAAFSPLLTTRAQESAWALQVRELTPILGGVFRVEQVSAAGPAWLVIHSSDGTELGKTQLAAGQHQNVPVKTGVPWSGPQITVRLVADEGQPGVLEDSDPVQGEPVTVNTFCVVVYDEAQRARDVAELRAAWVVSPVDAWVVISLDTVDETVPQRYGAVAVPAGVSEDVAIPIENAPQMAGHSIVATLHIDAGEPGVLEWPGPDAPLMAPVSVEDMRPSQISREPVHIAEAYIRAADGLLNETQRTLTVPSVFAPGGGVLVLRTGGPDSQIIASAALQDGVSREVALEAPAGTPIPATAFLQVFDTLPEPGAPLDPPDFMSDTVEVMLSDGIMTGVGLVQADQSKAEIDALGGITVGRVVSSAPGWLEVFTSAGDMPTIAVVAVPPGVSRNLVVPLRPEDYAVGDILILRLHVDAGEMGVYESPGPDETVRRADGLALQGGLNVR
ncbi:MAG: hypothetical protein IT323_07005 [Anaerolineae bacterium]|nr:hypothetical protein [Anaerolineae bacterium]